MGFEHKQQIEQLPEAIVALGSLVQKLRNRLTRMAQAGGDLIKDWFQVFKLIVNASGFSIPPSAGK